MCGWLPNWVIKGEYIMLPSVPWPFPPQSETSGLHSPVSPVSSLQISGTHDIVSELTSSSRHLNIRLRNDR